MRLIRYQSFIHVAITSFLVVLLLRGPAPQAHKEIHSVPEVGPQQGIGIEEKLGGPVPLDLVFRDESGAPVALRSVIAKPTVLALVYYHCPDVCSVLLYNLTQALNRLPSEPGREYGVLSVSFDEMESPSLALERKKMYLRMMEKVFPEDAWRFLTGKRETILKLTDSVGFRFKREGDDFIHAAGLIVLSSEGRVIRYLYGTDFQPFEIKMALIEASEGRIGPSVAKVLRFCFSYDPKGRKYVFNTLKVTGSVTLLVAALFMTFLIFYGRRRHSDLTPPPPRPSP